MLVGIAPNNHGSTFYGLATLAELLIKGFGITPADFPASPSALQLMPHSEYMKTLNAGGGTVPGPEYVVIQTRLDLVITPYTAALLPPGPNVQNIILQTQCPQNTANHVVLTYDPVALQYAMNALGPNLPAFQADCSN
jgi:hypothetical protein